MANKTTIEIDGKNKGAIVAINGVKSELNSFSNDIKKHSSVIGSSMRTIAGYMASAFSVAALGAFVKESVDLASKWQGVNQAFQRLPDNQRLLENLRTSVKGTTDDLTLMQYAVRAENFKIPMDALIQGLEFAKIRASETGQSIDYMLDSFVTGMGRQSVKILDNLGISALEISNEFQKTGDFAKAVGNIMERELSKTDKSFTTAKDSSERLTASIKNFKIEVGQDLIDDLDKANLKLANLTDGFMDLNTQVKLFTGQGIIGNLIDAISNFNTMGVNLDKLTGIDDAVRNFIKTQQELKKHTAEVNKVFYETFSITNTAYPFLIDNTNKENDALNTQLNTVRQLKDEYAKLVEVKAAGNPQSVATGAGERNPMPDVTPMFEMFSVEENPFNPLENYAIDFFDMYDERSAIMRDMTSDAFGNMAGAADMFFQLGGQKSKAMFAIYKTFAIAQATISGYEAVMHSYKEGTKFGGPILGAIFAATAAAFSVAQIAKIAGTGMGSSGGSSAGGGGSSSYSNNITNPTSSGGGGTSQNFVITINGSYWDQDQIARNLIPALKKAYGDTMGGG